MDKKDSRYYLGLPYPDNLIRTICMDDGEITDDRVLGLQHALETLSPREKEVVDVRFQERKSYRQIGDIYDLPVDRIRMIYERAMRKLRTPGRFDLIELGYATSLKEKEKAEAMERQADEEAFRKAVEHTGNPALLNMPVQEIGLSARVVNRLTHNGIITVKDLWIIAERHFEEYVRIRSLGELGRMEIYNQLRSLGFILKGENKNG